MADERDKNGRFTGKKPGPGRPKGCKNQVPQGIKESVLWVANRLNETSDKSLMAAAEKDPSWFWEKIYSKMLPKNVDITGEIGVKALTDEQLNELLAKLRSGQA